jgi:DNA-binding MarR family transcriptional regulator
MSEDGTLSKTLSQASPWMARTMLVHSETGEIRDSPSGIATFIRTRHRAGRHMSMLMDALEAVASDPELTLRDHRVLRFIESRTEYANSDEGHPDAYIRLIQAEIARCLNMDRANVNRSIKKLLDRKVILRMAPSGQASQYYAINPNYGWRGDHGNWRNRRGVSPKLTLLSGGHKRQPVDKDGGNGGS